jgi:hypothetical protein
MTITLIKKLLLIIATLLTLVLIMGTVFYLFFFKPLISTTIKCGDKTFIQVGETDGLTFLYPSNVDVRFEEFKLTYLPFIKKYNTLTINKSGSDLPNQVIKNSNFVSFNPLYRNITEIDKSDLKICFPGASIKEAQF